MEFGQWSDYSDSYSEDRQDFVHKLEFEVSFKGENYTGVTSGLSGSQSFDF